MDEKEWKDRVDGRLAALELMLTQTLTFLLLMNQGREGVSEFLDAWPKAMRDRRGRLSEQAFADAMDSFEGMLDSARRSAAQIFGREQPPPGGLSGN